MKIIKYCENILQIIAGEMLNIEASTLYFIDGKLTKAIHGYPKIIDGTSNDPVA